MYNGVVIDIKFPLALYKKLLGISVSHSDLMDIDPELGKGLQDLLVFDGDVQDVFQRTYRVDITTLTGEIHSVDLIPNGADVPLTNENAKHFVERYTEYLLVEGISSGFTAFKAGFDSLLDSTALVLFRPEEVLESICGTSTLDFHDLEAGTKYDGFESDSPMILYTFD
jgi:hypothetical protein